MATGFQESLYFRLHFVRVRLLRDHIPQCGNSDLQVDLEFTA